MRCPYCFQVIQERSERCSSCGSRLPVGRPTAAGEKTWEAAEKATLPLSNQQMISVIAGTVLVLSCLCLGLAALIQPALLPPGIVVAIPGLASPTPMPTFQVTRAALTLATPSSFEVICDRQERFCARFPSGWVLVDQSLPGWVRNVETLGEAYPWAPLLFAAGSPPRQPRLVAVPPSLINLERGRVAQMTVGENVRPEIPLTLDQLEIAAQEDPGALALLVSDLVGENLAVRRFDRIEVDGQAAGLVVFEGRLATENEPIPVRIYLYLIPKEERLYTFSYLADETTLAVERDLFEEVVSSFQVQEE